jgi:hypothetical protein
MSIYRRPSHLAEESILIRAKFESECSLTGEKIHIGDECLWDRAYGKVYAKYTSYYNNYVSNQIKQNTL